MRLYEHQQDGLSRLQNYNSCALYWDMGLGKTYAGLCKALEVGDRILIVSPLSVIPQWENAVKSCGISIFNHRGKRQPKNERIGIINYDLIWRKSPIDFYEYDTIIFDESQNLGNDKNKRTKWILKNLSDRNIILLSGTPDGGKYEKLYPQLKLLDPSLKKREFYDNYIETTLIEYVAGIRSRVITGYKNIDELKRYMRGLGCDFLKTSDCINLPAQNDITINVSMTSDYRKFQRDLVLEVQDKFYVGDSVMQELVNLRKLATAGKKTAMIELLTSTDKPLIVFYNFNDELELLTGWCAVADKNYYVVNGQMKHVEGWEADPQGVLLVQYQAGASGLNLQYADTVIYLSLPYSSMLFEQSKKRIHRLGQQSPCYYYYMIMDGSIDKNILDTLKKRKDYADYLFINGR